VSAILLSDDSSSLEASARLGQLFVSQQKLQEAKATFDALTTRRPGTAAAVVGQLLVAFIRQLQSGFAEAQCQRERMLAASPQAIIAANNVAWFYAERGGDLDVALELANAAARQAPHRPEINDTLGWVYYKKGRLALAIAAFQRAIDQDELNPTYAYHLGLAYLKTGDRATAKRLFEHALILNPDFDGSSDARTLLASITD
jgi:tetratricopeptide (TPR) repeat protein